MKKILFLALVLFAPATFAYDEVCGDSCMDRKGTLPTCEELGYSADRFCPEGYITCPFDENYIWCKSFSCDMGGYVTENEAITKRSQGYLCYKTKFHGLTCYDCDEVDKSICIYDNTNKGEGVLGGVRCGDGTWTECTRTCADRDQSASLPSVPGVIPTAEICMSCGVQETIITGFTCAENYTKTGNTCEPTACPTPTSYTDILYTASGLTGCGDKAHPEGWIFEQKGKSGGVACSRCVPKACPLGFEAKLESCPNTVGYTYENNGFSGDDVCGYCNSLKCVSPYNEAYQSVDNCPKLSNEDWTVAKAWTYSRDTMMSGDKYCGLCEPKACADGYNQAYQSLSDCPNTVGYTFDYDKNHFYGDKYCGRCVEKTCSQGQANLALSECVSTYGYASQIGASVVATEEYVGSSSCKVCQCKPETLCPYTSANIGDSGEGVNVCCDGTSYQECHKKSSCDGVEAESIEHASATSVCSACGHTYLKATACEEGYKPAADGKSCVQKTCDDYGLQSSASGCDGANGYVAKASAEHSGCFSCEAKTCEAWGEDVGQTWHLFATTSACEDGYSLTKHSVKIAGVSKQCYDCESCSLAEGYISVASQEAIPAIVTEKNVVKSCDKYQYCATSCADGYTVSGCSCVEATCAGYTNQTGLTKVDDNTYTDGVHNYGVCKKGGTLLYKINGCASGYTSITSCSGIGAIREGSNKNGYACYRCVCGDTSTICSWNSGNIGAGGRGVNVCCDGSSYMNCEKNTSTCSYTLTTKPGNAETTDTCEACGVTYHKVTKCKTGYSGETCTSCDTGYANCKGTCQKEVTCANGTAKCTETGWACECYEGYKGATCSECDSGYRNCDGVCYAEFSCGSHGSLQCGASGLVCSCTTGYAGAYCNTCAEGFYDYGNGCVLVQGCGHGTFNGTECVCDECYEHDSGGKCTKISSKCHEEGGEAKPNTCAKPYGYKESCDWNCESCISRTVETTTGTLNCFEVTSTMECSNFCGFVNKSTSAREVLDDPSYCGADAPVSHFNGYASWLTDTNTGISINHCGKTCYFDDTICSAGEKLTNAEKSQREAQGDVCTLVGSTGAGSSCYNCISDVCETGLTHQSLVSEQEAAGYVCTLKTGKETPKGSSCYECLSNFCENGAAYSSEDVDAKALQYAFVRSTVPFVTNNYTYDSVSRTGTGAYCYKNFAPANCSSVSANDLYTTASACISAISDKVGFNNYVMADCHACVETSNGTKFVRWYPACLSAYENAPQDSESGVYYQNGENCCVVGYENTLGENIQTPIYGTTLINLRTYKLGTAANAQTCYTTNTTCQLVESGYCGGTLCTEVTCEGYAYDYTNKPEHGQLSGASCVTRTTSCQTGDVAHYADFECDTNYVKSGDTCVLSCDNAAGAYAEAPAGAAGIWQNGCFYPTGCADGYLTTEGAGTIFALSSTANTFNINNGIASRTCYEVTGCKAGGSVAQTTWNSNNYSDFFKSSVHESGSVKCLVPTGCASGKNGYQTGSSYTCSNGFTLENTISLIDWTCGECHGCKQCSDFTSHGVRLQSEACAAGYIDTIENRALCTNSSATTGCHKCSLPKDCHVTNTAALHSTMGACQTAVGTHGSCSYCSFDGDLYVEPSCAAGYKYSTNTDSCEISTCEENHVLHDYPYVNNVCQNLPADHGLVDTCWYSSGGYAGFETISYYCAVAPEGYGRNDEDCGQRKVINTNVTNGTFMGQTLYQCVCDQNNGYYESCPAGAACDTAVNGCVKTTGCATGWVEVGSANLQYFITGRPKEFNLNGNTKYCVEVGQCNETIAVTQSACYARTNGSDGWNWVEKAAGCGLCTAKQCTSPFVAAEGSTCACGWYGNGEVSGENACCQEASCQNGEIPTGTNYVDNNKNYGPVDAWKNIQSELVCDSNYCKSVLNTCWALNECPGYYGTSNKPTNAKLDTTSETCIYRRLAGDGKSCGMEETRYAEFTCNSGYKKNDAGTACVAMTCGDYLDDNGNPLLASCPSTATSCKNYTNKRLGSSYSTCYEARGACYGVADRTTEAPGNLERRTIDTLTEGVTSYCNIGCGFEDASKNVFNNAGHVLFITDATSINGSWDSDTSSYYYMSGALPSGQPMYSTGGNLTANHIANCRVVHSNNYQYPGSCYYGSSSTAVYVYASQSSSNWRCWNSSKTLYDGMSLLGVTYGTISYPGSSFTVVAAKDCGSGNKSGSYNNQSNFICKTSATSDSKFATASIPGRTTMNTIAANIGNINTALTAGGGSKLTLYTSGSGGVCGASSRSDCYVSTYSASGTNYLTSGVINANSTPSVYTNVQQYSGSTTVYSLSRNVYYMSDPASHSGSNVRY